MSTMAELAEQTGALEARIDEQAVTLKAMTEKEGKDTITAMRSAMEHMDEKQKAKYKAQIEDGDDEGMKAALSAMEDEEPKKTVANDEPKKDAKPAANAETKKDDVKPAAMDEDHKQMKAKMEALTKEIDAMKAKEVEPLVARMRDARVSAGATPDSLKAFDRSLKAKSSADIKMQYASEEALIASASIETMDAEDNSIFRTDKTTIKASTSTRSDGFTSYNQLVGGGVL